MIEASFAKTNLTQEIQRLRRENQELRDKEKTAIDYIREKVNHLLLVMGTLPLKPEELDDDTLLALDPIGIISDSFAQVLEHLKKTNENLVLAHDEIQAIFDSAGAAILVVDPEMRVQAYNIKSKELFLGETTNIADWDFREVLCRPNISLEESVFDKVLKTEKSSEQSDFVYGDQHFCIAGTPIKDKNGNISKVVLVYTDITDRKRSEELLREAEGRLKTIFNSIPAGIVVIDAKTHTIVDVNESAAEMIEDPRKKIIGAVCHKYLCPFEEGQCPITDLGHKIDNSERILLNTCGEKIPVLKTVTSLMLGGREHLLESFIDISDWKEAERALGESENKYRNLYSSMKEGVALHELIYDKQEQPIDYIFHDVNPSFEHILGLRKEKIIGKKASDIYGTGKAPYLEIYSKVVATGMPTSFKVTVKPTGKTFNISVASPAKGKFATIFDDITDQKRAEDEIQKLAYFDTLTSLPNRTLMRDRIDQSLAQAQRSKEIVGVMFLDIDRFKDINDTLGHVSGDELLKAIAERLRSCVRQSDTVARVGGDEFVIILNNVKSQQDVIATAGKVLAVLRLPVELNGQEVFSTGSLGIALYPMDGEEADILLKNADTAMYQAKEQGRNTYQFYTSDMNAQAFERLLLGNDLRRALERGEFSLHYQPQICLKTGKMVGAEALLRWHHPDLGLLAPATFIPLAEETGLILPLGLWVLKTACGQNKAWQDMGFPPFKMAVNLSGRQFKQLNLTDTIRQTLNKAGLDPTCLELEITESILMENAPSTRKILQELKLMGVQISIDDFGTGYSSLSYLKHFPIDRLKIDRSFVHDVNYDSDDAAIAEAIIALGHSLRIKVLAEGVETKEQLDFLRELHCDEMQGYYFSRPLSLEDFTELLNSGLAAEDVCLFQGRK